jgi:hypothetical protein
MSHTVQYPTNRADVPVVVLSDSDDLLIRRRWLWN